MKTVRVNTASALVVRRAMYSAPPPHVSAFGAARTMGIEYMEKSLRRLSCCQACADTDGSMHLSERSDIPSALTKAVDRFEVQISYTESQC